LHEGLAQRLLAAPGGKASCSTGGGHGGDTGGGHGGDTGGGHQVDGQSAAGIGPLRSTNTGGVNPNTSLTAHGAGGESVRVAGKEGEVRFVAGREGGKEERMMGRGGEVGEAAEEEAEGEEEEEYGGVSGSWLADEASVLAHQVATAAMAERLEVRIYIYLYLYTYTYTYIRIYIYRMFLRIKLLRLSWRND